MLRFCIDNNYCNTIIIVFLLYFYLITQDFTISKLLFAKSFPRFFSVNIHLNVLYIVPLCILRIYYYVGYIRPRGVVL